MKFNNLIDDYLQFLKLERGLSENSLNAYATDLNEFYLLSKVESPQSVTSQIINNFLN
jgi:integrase/recombinase XerD